MSGWMDLLRGPALGVVIMIGLTAVVIIVTAFAALIAQMALLLRLRPWNTAEKKDSGSINIPTPETGRATYAAIRENRPDYSIGQRETQPENHGVIDAVWWEAVK